MKQRDVERIVKLEAEIERLQGKINDAKRKIALIRNQNCEPTDTKDCTGRLIYTNDVVRYAPKYHHNKNSAAGNVAFTGKAVFDLKRSKFMSNPWYLKDDNGNEAWLAVCLASELEILS